jgi:mRNA interferase MazF
METTAVFDNNGELIIGTLPSVKNRKAKVIIFLDDDEIDTQTQDFSDFYSLDESDFIQHLVKDPGVEYNRIKEGDIALVELPQSAGAFKLRPAVILKQLPKFHDFLVCGISSQQHQYVENFDEMIDENHELFPLTGLHKNSMIRLSSLAVFSIDKILRSIGKIPPAMHTALLQRLGEFILK